MAAHKEYSGTLKLGEGGQTQCGYQLGLYTLSVDRSVLGCTHPPATSTAYVASGLGSLACDGSLEHLHRNFVQWAIWRRMCDVGGCDVPACGAVCCQKCNAEPAIYCYQSTCTASIAACAVRSLVTRLRLK